MRLVVDASVAAKWLIPESDSAIAMQLLDRSYELHAPRVLVSEVANVLWRNAVTGSLPLFEADRLAAAVTEMSLTWDDDESICAEALRIAVELGHPVYDCMYLALARRIGAKVVTADERFVSAAASTPYRLVIVPLWDFFGEDDGGLLHMQTPKRPPLLPSLDAWMLTPACRIRIESTSGRLGPARSSSR